MPNGQTVFMSSTPTHRRKTYAQYERILRMNNPFLEQLGLIGQEPLDRPHVKSWYHAEPTTYYHRTLREFEGFKMEVLAGDRILDWGCSTGISTIAIANMHPLASVVGIDVDPMRILIAQRKTVKCAKQGYVTVYSNSLGCMVHEYIGDFSKTADIRLPTGFMVADGFHAPFRDRAFRAVYCTNNLYFMLDNMPEEEKAKSLRSISRMVSDSGFLLVAGTTLVQRSFVLRRTSSGFSCAYVNFSKNDREPMAKLECMLRHCNS